MDDSFELPEKNIWTIYVDTTPELPDEVFYIKNVYGEQTVEQFKDALCNILNRKPKKTKFFREGMEMENKHTLDFYYKNTPDVCIQHAQKHPSKYTMIRWINALS